MEFKAIPSSLKADEDTAGGMYISGYFSTFGGPPDAVGDIIEPGAFKRTIKNKGPKGAGKILGMWRHWDPLGKIVELLEDKKGAWFRMRLSETRENRENRWPYLLDGVVPEVSFAFDPVKSKEVETEDGKFVRILKEVKLYEISPVPFGANDRTSIDGFKALLAAELGLSSVKGATTFSDLPLASREKEWDAAAASARVRSWADAEDEPNEKYRRAFFWYDSETADTFGAYKLQFADVVDGKLVAVPRGIFAVAAVLQGARGGVDIPSADEAKVKSHVEKYYAKMRREFDDDSIVAPWNKSYIPNADEIEKVKRALSAQNKETIGEAIEVLKALLASEDSGEKPTPKSQDSPIERADPNIFVHLAAMRESYKNLSDSLGG